MSYKMKGFSGFKSPLKQDDKTKKEFKGINWDTLENVSIDFEQFESAVKQ